MNWHLLSAKEVMELTGSNPHGLTGLQVETLQQKYGPNELQEAKRKSPLMMFIGQFMEVMILVLVAAAVISGLIGDLKDTIVIVAIIIINAIIGFVQELRAEKAMQSLKQMAAPFASVLRNGSFISIPAAALVPGDMVLLEAGSMVPADIRLVEVHSLKVEESSLTGESHAVEKSAADLHQEDLPIGDRVNMVYKGTSVTYGRAKGAVVATGMDTELGRIAKMLQEKGSSTPLQVRMADFSKKLSLFIILLCALLFVMGYLRGEELIRMLLTVLSLAVAAIPEALPAVITIALAIGAKRLVKNHALARKLHAVETLGSVTYICSDKTGTLTQNSMTVMEVWEPGTASEQTPIASALMLGMTLNHDVKLNEDGSKAGDPTEIALVNYTETDEVNMSAIIDQLPRVGEIPFDSERKCMTTLHAYNGKVLAITKGAAESVLACCKPGTDANTVNEQAKQFAEKGMRVLAFGVKWMDSIPEIVAPETVEKDLGFAGLAAMIDPPRPEVTEAIRECRTAGIIPVMITGDHPITARVIAQEIGILRSKADKVITGAELAKMTDEEFESEVEHIRVYARVSPEQKLNIVKALQDKRHFVAMTGDGVNDAPSLKKANIGVAMGITGTDVSKEASDMILLDDNFATIVKAVREGRRIYDNIRKFIKYILTGNSAEIWTIMLAPLVGLPIPLLPIHILWINLVTDGLPALALAAEPEEKSIMQRKPRPTNESIFAGALGFHIIWVGLLIGVITIATQAFEIHYMDNKDHWQTIVFTVLCLAQMWHVMAIRSEKQSLFSQGIFSNKALLGAVMLTFLLQLCTIYVPFMNDFFRTQPLTWDELLLAIGLSAIVFVAVELEKMLKRMRDQSSIKA